MLQAQEIDFFLGMWDPHLVLLLLAHGEKGSRAKHQIKRIKPPSPYFVIHALFFFITPMCSENIHGGAGVLTTRGKSQDRPDPEVWEDKEVGPDSEGIQKKPSVNIP